VIRALLASLLLAICTPAWGQVAYVSDVEGTTSSSATHTLTSGCSASGNLNITLIGWVSGETITGVTCNGAAMTAIGTVSDTETGRQVTAYWRASPTAGNVVISYSGSVDHSAATAITFSGANTGGPVGTVQESGGFTSLPTTTAAVTSSASGLVVDVLTVHGAVASNITQGASQDVRSAIDDGEPYWHRTSTKAGAASVTMSWTGDDSLAFAHLVIPIIAAAGGSSAVPIISQVNP
jgi:hypothetical protein